LGLIKKIVFGTFVVLSVCLAVWGYNYLKQNKKPSTDVLALLPDSCSYYFSTKKFSELSVKLNSQSLIFNSWNELKEIKELRKSFHYFDSLIYANESLADLISNNTIHLSVYNDGKSHAFISGFNLKELKQESDIKEFCKTHFKEQGSGFFELRTNLFAGVEQGVLLLSNSVKWLNKAFEKGTKLKNNKTFIDQINQVGQTDQLRVFIDHQLTEHSIIQVNKLLMATESVADLKLNPNEIIINGNYKPTTALSQQLISTQEQNALQFFDELPFSVSTLEAYAISAPGELQKIVSSNELHQNIWKKINDKALYNASTEFYQLMDGVLFSFESFKTNYIGFKINDSIKCRELMEFLGDRDTVYQNTLISKLHSEDFSEACFGSLFKQKPTHVFQFNSCFYFASGIEAAKELIYALSNNSTLRNNSTFIAYATENLNTSCNYFYYTVPNLHNDLVKALTTIDLNERKESTSNLTEANLTVTKQKGSFKFRMQLNYRSPFSNEIPNLLWQCDLDSNLQTAPGIFVNHLTQENELVVQDKLDQVYLINSTGTVLWKKKINEAIRSTVYTVDIFRNKKHQILFNTDNYLHLIDRNGNYVQGYPVKLPAKATNALSLIDYDQDGNDRVFIACANKLIYNFTLYGVRSEGFKPFKTDAEVKLPVKFVRVGQSDYLITIDESGLIHAFSRKGDGRIGFKNKAVEQCQDFAIVSTNNINSTFLYYIDVKNNLINKISFADKKDVIKLRTDITNAQIKFDEVNNDQTPDFIAQTESGLLVYDINGTLIYENEKMASVSRSFAELLNGKTVYYNFETDKGAVVMASNENTELNTIRSNSPAQIFDLFNDHKKYMLYSLNGKLTCNLLK
jgi:hypothetical protein